MKITKKKIDLKQKIFLNVLTIGLLLLAFATNYKGNGLYSGILGAVLIIADLFGMFLFDHISNKILDKFTKKKHAPPSPKDESGHKEVIK